MSKWMISLLVVVQFYAQMDIHTFLKNVAEQNLSIKANYLEYKQQASTYYTTILPERPEISFERNEISKGRSISSANEKSVSISQSFEFPLNYYYKAKKAGLSEEIAYQAYLEKSLKVLLTAKKEAFKYYSLVQKQILIKDFIERYSVVLKQMKQMKSAGEVSEMDLLRISLEYEKLINDKQELDSKLLFQKELLKTYFPEFDGNLFISIEIDSTLNKAVIKEKLRTTLPFLVKATLEQEKANKSNTLSYLKRLPDLSFTYRRQDIENIKYNGFEFGFSIPLWVPKELEEIKQTQIMSQSASIGLKSGERDFNQFFKSTWSTYQANLSNWERFKSSLLPKSEKVFWIVQKEYQAGEISYLEFIDTYRVWKNIRLSELNQQLALQNSIAELTQTNLLKFFKKED